MPVLEGSKGMLDRLAPHVDQLRVGFHAGLPPFHNVFMHPAGNAAAFFVAGTLRPEGTGLTGGGFVLANMASHFMGVKSNGKGLARRAARHIFLRLINKLILRIQTQFPVGRCLRGGDIRF